VKPTRQILLINGSPRTEGHTQQILDAAKETLDGISGVETISCFIGGDNYEELAALWQKADGIIMGAPVYTYGPPSGLYAFFEYLRAHPAEAEGGNPPLKPIGLISQGGASYSGAEENANILQMLALSVGCVPVSAHMPGFSQAVIGQVADQSGMDPSLLEGAAGLAERLVEMIDLLAAGQNVDKVDVRLLCVTAGSGSAPALIDSVFKGAVQAPNCKVTTDAFDFHGKEIAPCLACTQYCSKDLECVYNDDMQEFRTRWLKADAVVWLVGAGEIGIDPGLIAAIDRLNQTRFEIHFAVGQPHMPRYLKSMGILASGSQPERIASALRFLHQTGILYQNVPVLQGRSGGCGIYHEAGCPLPETAAERAAALGKEAALLAGVIQTGLSALKGNLPEAYYPSKVNYGVTENNP
jgi:multimeric flavodoxin WrbA